MMWLGAYYQRVDRGLIYTGSARGWPWTRQLQYLSHPRLRSFEMAQESFDRSYSKV